MKTKATRCLFVLFAIAAGMITMTLPSAFADHVEVTIESAPGSSVQGCEETAEGCFIPNPAIVDVGGKVIFANTDTAAHTYTAGSTAELSGVFDSGLVLVGSTYEWEPTEAGDVPYFCLVHPWMEGMITVQEVRDDDKKYMDDDKKYMDDDKKYMDDDKKYMDDDKKYMDDASGTGMLSDGTEISIWTTEATEGMPMEISIKFYDSEHVNMDVMVTQNDEEVLMEEGVHTHTGKSTLTTASLNSDDAVDIEIIFQGYGTTDPKTGPIGDVVMFANIVPEFGTIAMMILAVAIISVVAVTSKSRVIPRF